MPMEVRKKPGDPIKTAGRMMTSGPAAEPRWQVEPQIKIIHSAVSGRVRLQVPGLYRAPNLGARIEQRVSTLPGVQRVRANALTGRVLIEFDRRKQSVKSLLQALRGMLSEWSARQPLRIYPSLRRRATLLGPSTHQPGLDLRVFERVIDAFYAHLAQVLTHARGAPNAPATRPPAPPWHALQPEQLHDHLQADPARGLTAEEVSARLQRYGENRLVTLTRRSDVSILLDQIMSVPVAMLGVSAVISVATGGVADAAVILTVVAINSVIGYATERHSERTILALTGNEPRYARVLRAGELLEIPAEQVVPGDVVWVTPGSYVTADTRLLQAVDLTVDESSLTGESLPVRKMAEAQVAADAPLGDRPTMLFAGTVVTGGSGQGIVVATGTHSELGEIQALAGAARPPETPLQRQLQALGTRLGLLSGAVCVGIFGLGLLRGYGLLAMLKSSVSLAVAAVPEGLPAVATTTLALGIQKMRRHHVAIRHLDAVETLGAVQVFCMDKTGTLTRNHMTAVRVNAGGHSYDTAEGEFFEPSTGALIRPDQHLELQHLLQVVTLCSEVTLSDGGAQPVLEGSPTEIALLELALHQHLDVRALRAAYPVEEVIHRAEDRPYMVTRHRARSGEVYLAVKGSPAEVLGLCDRIQQEQHCQPLNETLRAQILAQNMQMAGDALRVLGVAYAQDAAALDAGSLIWLGLVGMADPLREGMPALIDQFHRSGIDTVMITGDQSATAYAIGQQLGLSREGPIKILDSSSLEAVDPDLMTALVEDLQVFARVSPKHKLQIVQALQRSGKVVAMTGDGINDGPALKAADIGVAMGGSGTDVARSVADVVLEDDNLHTMIIAIEQGRTIYENIRKTLHFLLSTNFAEIEVMLVGILTGRGEIMNPMQLLWINLISDIFPGLALSVEPPEENILERAPREPDEPIISARDLKTTGLESFVITASVMAVYALAVQRGAAPARANSVAFTTLANAELLHAIFCRSTTRSLFDRERRAANPALNLAIGGSLVAQIMTILLPALRRLLGTTRLTRGDWLISGLGAIAPLLVNEALKIQRRGHSPSPTKKSADAQHTGNSQQ